MRRAAVAFAFVFWTVASVRAAGAAKSDEPKVGVSAKGDSPAAPSAPDDAGVTYAPHDFGTTSATLVSPSTAPSSAPAAAMGLQSPSVSSDDPVGAIVKTAADWAERYIAERKKGLLVPACGDANKKAVKKACSKLEDVLDQDLDSIEPALEAVREGEDAAAEAGRPGVAASLDGTWPAADSANAYTKGLEKIVHWYYRSAGKGLDTLVADFSTTRKAKTKLDQDVEDAEQLGLSKADKNAKKKEASALGKELSKKESAMSSEKKKVRKQAAKDLDKWGKDVRKNFKLALKRKDLCACP